MGKYTIAYSSLKRKRRYKKMADLFERRIIYEENECNKSELLMEECLKIHRLVFYENLHFEKGHRLIDYSYKKEKREAKI